MGAQQAKNLNPGNFTVVDAMTGQDVNAARSFHEQLGLRVIQTGRDTRGGAALLSGRSCPIKLSGVAKD